MTLISSHIQPLLDKRIPTGANSSARVRLGQKQVD